MNVLTKGAVLFNTYEIIDVIGSGGGGITYKARHLRLQTYVVVKKIKDEIVNRVNIRAEADILKNLKHAYLPRVYDFIETEDGIYTVMDYIPGDNLEDAVNKHGPFNQNLVLKWANQLAEALAYLHSQNPPIIHSDIKPSNIMLTDRGDICLIDFNISLALGENVESAVGVSPGYSPPEQFKNVESYIKMVISHTGSCSLAPSMVSTPIQSDGTEILPENKAYYSSQPIYYTPTDYSSQIGRGIDPGSDIYSLGMTLIYLLTGVKSSLDYERRINFSDFQMYVSEGFGAIIRKMVNYIPEYRYRDGVELLNELRNIHKLDSRYRAVKHIQNTMQILAAILFAVGLCMVSFGIISGKVRNNSQYNKYIDKAEQYIEDGDYDKAESSIKKALAMDSDKCDAHKERIYLLYSKGEYEKTVEEGFSYINSPTLKAMLKEKSDKAFKANEQSIGDIFYLIGNAYYELGKYSDAVDFFEQALEVNTKNSDYYRDYAIALAKLGKKDEALEQLSNAEELGLADDSTYLVKGQIAILEEDYKKAAKNFKESMEHAESEQIFKRAMFLCSESYNALGGSYIDKNIEMLNKYRDSFGETGSLMVKEYLAIAYMKKAEDEPEYNEKALEQFKDIVDAGYSSFQTQENMAIIYENLGRYEEAVNVLFQLADQYPNNYEVYKDLAFLEIYSQGDKDVSLRDYHNFEKYYSQAKSLCEQLDDEMEMLKRAEEDLIAGGWELN